MNVRKRIYEIIEVAEKDDAPSRIYDAVMIVSVFFSLLPLLSKDEYYIFSIAEYVTATIFLIDYFLYWLCSDYRLNKGLKSFILYPFTTTAIIDFLAVVPPLLALKVVHIEVNQVLRLFILLRLLKIFRAAKYFKQFYLVARVLKKQKQALMVVFTLAITYILIVAAVVNYLEDNLFKNYFEAVYWATITLASVGYGDFVPLTVAGRIVTMFSSIFGIAIIALPSGIISAGYMDELNKMLLEQRDSREEK